MDDLRRLGVPILVIIISAILSRIVQTYISGRFVATLLTIIMAVALFYFGYALNNRSHRRNPSLIKQIIAILLFVFLLFMQLGYFVAPFLSGILAFLGYQEFYVHMIYIFAGYLLKD